MSLLSFVPQFFLLDPKYLEALASLALEKHRAGLKGTDLENGFKFYFLMLVLELSSQMVEKKLI